MKLSEIWDSWILVKHIWATYDLVVFKVILGSNIPVATMGSVHKH